MSIVNEREEKEEPKADLGSKMRKRELQSIPLKLAELKEYDIARNERAMARTQGQPEDTVAEQPSPIANVGPKTKQEIQARLNTTM